ncbi:MAG: hypothetical protein ACP6IQ_01025 [Candidatus Njordarchaeia archaeon]|nr:hypothetical protein [Candidatus Korarchaeota archaeon]
MSEEKKEKKEKKKRKINWRNGFPFAIGLMLSYIPIWLLTSGILLRLGYLAPLVFVSMLLAMSAFIAHFEEDI